MSITKESRRGLRSTYFFKCAMCSFQGKISTEDRSRQTVDINTAYVAASYETGIGPTVASTLFAVMDIPSPSNATFAKISQKFNKLWPEIAEESMKNAGKAEAKLARFENRVLGEGTPYIYVTADGCWCKRSYGTNYSSSGGFVSRTEIDNYI